MLGAYIPIIKTLIVDDVAAAITSTLIITIYLKVIKITKLSKISSDTLENAFNTIFTRKQYFRSVQIFAYSAKNYINAIKKHKIVINELYLLLKRVDDYQAWFAQDTQKVNKYKNELSSVLDEVQHLVEAGQIKKLHIRFYDFESYSHFGIFGNMAISGSLVPLYQKKKTVKINTVQILGSSMDFGSAEELIENNLTFFYAVYDNASEDSGLKNFHTDCVACRQTKEILQGVCLSGSNTDVSLISNKNLIEDFILKPDFCPVSKLHLLIMCKFHILNLHDYLRHENAIEQINTLITHISNVVRQQYNDDILLFEHGTYSSHSTLSGNSINHLHLHVILKNNINFLQLLQKDNTMEDSVLNLSDENSYLQFQSLKSFARSRLIQGQDYFLIWDLSKDTQNNSKLFVFFPRKKESQYLRRLFYSVLTEDEKKELYPHYSKNGNDDYYDWKKQKKEFLNFSDETLERYYKLGKSVEDEYKKQQ